MLKAGDKFDSYKHFQSKLKEYEKVVLNNYWMRDCRTLKTQARRFPAGSAANASINLKYYYFRLACIKGGREHVAKNVQKKTTLTFKQGCQAGMFLKLSRCGKYLQIVSLNEEHNHSVSQSLFQTLPHQRLNLPEEVKASSRRALKAGGDKKIIRNKIVKATGCLITLKDLSNLGRKQSSKKHFFECVNILKNVYNCDVNILCDEDENLLCLFFQDAEMKKMFEAYPEIIFVDGTYYLHEDRAATYLILVEDSEGNGVVAAAGVLLKANEKTIDWFIEQFKESNPNTTEIKVIMSDKDSKERSSLERNFPNVSIQICSFHTMRIFNREVKNMCLTNEECETARTLFADLVYATSENAYEEVYERLKASVPEIVLEYYEKKWHPIKEQWVLYLTLNSKSLNKTINKLENIIQKLKSVILRFSNLEEFIQNFFVCVNSTRVDRNISNTVHFHKVSTNVVQDTAEDSYKMFLTNYAFEKVQRQMRQTSECKNFQMIDGAKCVATTSEGPLEVTAKSCQCSFWTSMGLPCCHIFKFRSTLNLSLFDENLCLKRWTRTYFESHHPSFSTDDDLLDGTKTESPVTKRRALTNHQKFKMMNDECLKLSKLCSEVSSEIFYTRLEFVKSIVKRWSNNDDENRDEADDESDETDRVVNNVIQISIEDASTNDDYEHEDCCDIKDVELDHGYCKPYNESGNVGQM